MVFDTDRVGHLTNIQNLAVEFIEPFEKTGLAASIKKNLQKIDFKNESPPFRSKSYLKETVQEAVPDSAMNSGVDSGQGKGITGLVSEQGQAYLSGPEFLGTKSHLVLICKTTILI